MQDYKLVFYDFEVFKEDWLVVFKDYDTKKECIIVNDANKLKQFYIACKSQNVIFCGFNSRQYDTYIFKGILKGMNPYRISKDLIEHGKKGFQAVPKHWEVPLNNYDVMTGFHGLKTLEAFMGLSIEESNVDFNIDRKLTEDEINETIEYCRYDVDSTIKVFELNIDEFNAYIELINMFDLPLDYISKTKAQLGAIILDAQKPSESRGDEWELHFPNTLELGRYEFVKDWFLSEESRTQNAKLIFDAYGVETVVGYGGIHSARKNIKRSGILANFDISSMYPQTMIGWNTLSRNVKDANKFTEIRDLRLTYKHDGKETLSYALKILIIE